MLIHDRRRFLKLAAGFPLIVPAAALGKGGSVAPSGRVTVACIGTGWQGGNDVQSFLAEPGAQVVAVCDIDSEHLAQGRAAAVEISPCQWSGTASMTASISSRASTSSKL